MTMITDKNDKRREVSFSKYFVIYLRIALGTAFLSAVADRFGMWGAAGEANVFWGNFQSFMDYAALLNPYCPASLIPALSWMVTIAEIALGIGLIFGIYLRIVATASGMVLFCFTLGQIVGVGIKAPLDYSVFTASAASFLLAIQGTSAFSVDAFLAAGSSKRNDAR